MKIKSIYLESKGYTINEFRNKIIEEIKNRKLYGLTTRVSKYKLKLKYNENYIMIPYRSLENKSIKEIVDFYEEDIKSLFKEMESE